MTLVVLVVIFNFLCGTACLWIAYRIWQFKQKLFRLSEQISAIERIVHGVLYPAPNAIYKAQRSTSHLRERYAELGIKYERVQRILSILSVMKGFLRYTNLARFGRRAVLRSRSQR
jgi:hypothetical protein